MDNFLPPLQKNFNEIRDFITDSTLNNQLDETISFLIECLNINNGYIFLVLDDQKVVVSPSSSPKYLLPSVFSEFDLAIISKKEICSYSNLQVEISTEKSTKLISYFLGFPINISNNNVTGAICFYDFSDKELTQKEIKTIEFVIKQLQIFLDHYFEKNSLKKLIKSSLDRFDLFIENSKEIFYELKTDGTILFVSESWTNNVGHEVNEIVGKNTASLIHPDDVLHVSDFLSKLIVNQKSTQEVVYRLLHKDGYYVWHSSDVKLIEREGEYFYIGNCRDITEFIKVQNEISYQKEFYEKILDRLPIDLGVWDINHKYLYLNREAIKNDELRKYIIGKDDFEYAVHTGRDDSFAKKRRELFNKALTSKQIIEWEDVFLSLSGEQFYHTRKFIPIFDEGGNFEMMTGYGIDITESKRIHEEILKSRQLINSVIQNAAVGILVQGPQSEFLEYNKAACEMLGLTEEQMLGKSSFDPHWKVIHLDGAEFKPHEHPVPQAIKKLVPINNIIMGVHRPIKGDLVWLLVDAIPVLGESNELLYVICTFNDISARKNAEDALKISNERFTYASEATSDALWDWDMITHKIFVGESYSIGKNGQIDHHFPV